MAISAERIASLVKLGRYFEANNSEWQEVCERAERMNAWFSQEYIRLAVSNIAQQFLQEDKINSWLSAYPKLCNDARPKPTVGLVMAGNIPLVGFHDFLCIFIAGFPLRVKLSSKDTVLWQHIFRQLESWYPAFDLQVQTGEMLKGCDAYIATGSNNSSRYFEQYFQKYPHIIRRNRTSVAMLDGTETDEELTLLASDAATYFGLGCRNVTKIYVPEGYDFTRLLPFFNAYAHHFDHNKYKNNYDYQLAIYLLNKQHYMTNGSILLVENESPFAPIGVLHYGYYQNKEPLLEQLKADGALQCICSNTATANADKVVVPFGANQKPSLFDYADGVDTMGFLEGLLSS
ncbi:MAG: acyl-CoA reductase [Edaphocola sp.]